MTKARDLAGFASSSVTTTASDGLVLKGDGSSTDVVIKNGANATVATVSDGSTNLSVAGSVTGALARGAIQVGNSSGVAAALAKGTSGYVLTAGANDLSWAEAGGGATELITTLTASNSATLSFTGFDASKYGSYVFKVDIKPASSYVGMYARVSTDGGSSYHTGSSDYSSGLSGPAVTSFMMIAGGNGNTAANNTRVGDLTVINPDNTNTYTIFSSSISNGGPEWPLPGTGLANSAFLSTTTVNGIQFSVDTGNITSGTIRAYGFKK